MNDSATLTDFMFGGRVAGVATESMAVASDKELRRQWLDDLVPESCKPTNEGLRVEGVAHLMGHKNGRFGAYRFYALLSWGLARQRERQPVIERVELDHDRQELFLFVSDALQKPSYSPDPAGHRATGAKIERIEEQDQTPHRLN